MTTTTTPLDKAGLAARVARDIPRGSYVNLGIGLPTLVADHLRVDAGVTLHTENGMLGMGPAARGDAIDPDLVNAGKIPVTELPGASYFHQADSFAMMRGGHIDVCVLGAFEVSVGGDLANWSTGAPGAIPAVGGAMDLAVGARSTWVMMNLLTKDGRPKLVSECTLPLTGVGCVTRVYSDLAVIDLEPRADGAHPVVVRAVETFGVTHEELAELLGLPVDS
jgi:3-oxoadipate CoA-transferase beta subunit